MELLSSRGGPSGAYQ